MGFKSRVTNVVRQNSCPNCGDRVIPIAYGYPGEEMTAAAMRGEISLGGCNYRMDGIDASHLCTCCSRMFFEFAGEFLPLANWRTPRAVLPCADGAVAAFLTDARGARRIFEIPESDLDQRYFSEQIRRKGYADALL